MTRTPTVEIEGPDTGWVASAGYDDTGDLRVLDARDEWRAEISRLLERLLAERQRDVVSYTDWQVLDTVEKERGEAAGGRPRVKFTRVEDMLQVLDERRGAAV